MLKANYLGPLGFYTNPTFFRHKYINKNISFICFSLSHLLHEIWGNAPTSYLDPLKTFLKKSVLAKTLSEFSAPSEQLFQRTNIVNFVKLVFQKMCLMKLRHHIGDVPKPISNLFQINNNYHSYMYGNRSSQSLRTPIGRSETIYQTCTCIGSLSWNYISGKIPTDVLFICFKNIAELHTQSNKLPQFEIRLNV